MSSPEFVSLTPLIPAGDDVAASLDFYETKLGFERVFVSGEPPDMAMVKRGAAQILLYRNGDRALAEQISFRMMVAGLDALHAEYTAAGAPAGKLEVKPWGLREFHLIDPAGVCLHFYEDRS